MIQLSGHISQLPKGAVATLHCREIPSKPQPLTPVAIIFSMSNPELTPSGPL